MQLKMVLQVLNARFRPYLLGKADTLEIKTQVVSMVSILLAQYVHAASHYSEGMSQTGKKIATVLFLVSNAVLTLAHLRIISAPMLAKLRGALVAAMACARGIESAGADDAEGDEVVIHDNAVTEQEVGFDVEATGVTQPPLSPRMQHDEIQIELSPVVTTSSEEKRAKMTELVQSKHHQGLAMKQDPGQDPLKSPIGRQFMNSKLCNGSSKAQRSTARQSSRGGKGANRTETSSMREENNGSPRSTAADIISTTSASGAEFNSEDAQAATIARTKRTRQGRLSEARLLQQQRQQSWLHASSKQRVESSKPLRNPTAKQSQTHHQDRTDQSDESNVVHL